MQSQNRGDREVGAKGHFIYAVLVLMSLFATFAPEGYIDTRHR
jgi:hypothetical protein